METIKRSTYFAKQADRYENNVILCQHRLKTYFTVRQSYVLWDCDQHSIIYYWWSSVNWSSNNWFIVVIFMLYRCFYCSQCCVSYFLRMSWFFFDLFWSTIAYKLFINAKLIHICFFYQIMRRLWNCTSAVTKWHRLWCLSFGWNMQILLMLFWKCSCVMFSEFFYIRTWKCHLGVCFRQRRFTCVVDMFLRCLTYVQHNKKSWTTMDVIDY